MFAPAGKGSHQKTPAALEEMSIRVEDHECLVLVGPSGSGKSTALRIVAGLEEPTGGEVLIGGRRVTHLQPRDRNIAMVFQSYALYPHMSVDANLAFGLRLSGHPKADIEGRVKEVAQSLDISRFLLRKPRQLSGGQRQRVALGRAIVRRPDVFLMDEPLSNLDAQLRVQTRVELERLHHQIGSTVIYVTHDQTEAMTLGDRIVVLKDGRVQQAAPPSELYANPSNTFVGRFIGSPSMNLIPLEVTGLAEGGGASLAANGIQLEVPAARAEAAGLTRGRRVLLGVRPEHIRDLAAAERLGLTMIEGAAEVVEHLGAETLIYVRVGDELVTARFGGMHPAEPDQKLQLGLDLEMAHLFDEESGLNLEADRNTRARPLKV